MESSRTCDGFCFINLFGTVIRHLAISSNVVCKRTAIFLFLLQYYVIAPGQAISAQHRHFPPHHSLDTDKEALLAFKRTAISSDPNSVLSNWNEATHVCNFTGVTCNKHHHRVGGLRLTNTELVGLLSPFIANLTCLRVLELVNNNLFGKIPSEFSSLQHLRWLWLEGNNLQGKIPESFSLFTRLTVAILRANNLTGELPPPFFYNCTLLKFLDLSVNSLSGKIPAEVGNCISLWNLELSNNQFSGEIPLSIMNTTQMELLDVEHTQISGELPSEIVSKLPELRILHLSYTNMASSNLDPFFTALANCTGLQELGLAGLGLGGTLPSS